MKFDPYTFLTLHGMDAADDANRASRANPDAAISMISTLSTLARAPAEISTASPSHQRRSAPSHIPRGAPHDQDDLFLHGKSAAGDPLTWTGKVVPLDDWRHLSHWERHGSDGRLFCGLCRAWVAGDGFPRCHKEDRT